MYSAAKILKQLNKEQLTKIVTIATDASVDGVARFLENKGLALDLPQLSTQEKDNYVQDVKRILIEENIPEDKHKVIIDCCVDFLNYYLENGNKVTASNLDQWAAEKSLFEQSLIDKLATIGYSATNPDYVRVALRVAELPLQKNLSAILATKVMEITCEKSGISAKDLAHTFDSSSSSDDSDSENDNSFTSESSDSDTDQEQAENNFRPGLRH